MDLVLPLSDIYVNKKIITISIVIIAYSLNVSLMTPLGRIGRVNSLSRPFALDSASAVQGCQR